MKHKIFLGLGTNVGDKKKNIDSTIVVLSKKIVNMQTASIYETKPWGYKNQDNFLNTAISGETSLSPVELLSFVKSIEQQIGRVQRFTWGPREIDIDILFYGNLVINEPNLRIPHSRLQDRDFVLKPLLDLNPDFVHPVLHKSIRELYEAIPEEERVIVRSV